LLTPWIVSLSIFLALAALAYAFLTVRQTRNQLREIQKILEDIKAGNGKRRILAEPHEPTAPLVYLINAIVRSYEHRLSGLLQAEEANRQLMTSLSHDVRTPLTTLIGYLDAAHRGIVVGKAREDYLETARRKAYDLKEYIDVLFDWFKLNSNEFSLHLEAVELAEASRTILIDWVPILEDRQLDYHFEIPEGPLPVKLDAEGYARVLNNLIQNILTHSQADNLGIALSVQGQRVHVTVSDDGVGIDKEDLHRIFDRLYKCDKGRSGKGSGLGLSIVRQLVEKMGGNITADSVVGKGTTFYLSFPLAR
jgi:signal transduction histidine kinase